MPVFPAHGEPDLVEIVQYMRAARPAETEQLLAVAKDDEAFFIDGAHHAPFNLFQRLDG
jgi:hypothetical protein